MKRTLVGFAIGAVVGHVIGRRRQAQRVDGADITAFPGLQQLSSVALRVWHDCQSLAARLGWGGGSKDSAGAHRAEQQQG